MMSTEREIRKRSNMCYGPIKSKDLFSTLALRKPVNVKLGKLITGAAISALVLIKDEFVFCHIL